MQSYFVIMLNFRTGLEAIVHPEDTRRATIDRVREALGDGNEIAFIHYVHDGVVEDVTAELIAAADYHPEREEVDLQAMRFDHAADLRKHHVEEV